MDAATGPGTRQRPSRSIATTRSTGCASMPSNRSGTARAVTPRSASCAQTLRPGAVSPPAQARTAFGTSAAASAASILAAKSRCCASRSNLIWLSLPRQPQQTLGGDVALHLVGTGVNRAAESEQQPVGPGAGQLGVGAADVQRGLVHGDVEVGPEHLGHRGLGAQLAAARQPGHGAEGVQSVG